MFNPAGFDLLALDEVIESYDYDTDPVLQEHFRPIEDALWALIERYGEGLNNYGHVMAAHLRRTSLDGMKFMTDVLGFSAHAGRNFHAANLFHDLGKIHADYDAAIWDLPTRPTEQQRAEKRKHTLRGAQTFAAAIESAPPELHAHPHIKIVIPALQIFHHERLDGKGPMKRAGHEQGKMIKAAIIADTKDGDMHRREHQSLGRTEAHALLRMRSLPDYDADGKYDGAFDDMLDDYISYREEQTGEAIYPAGQRARA